jgi:hypothetical protein
MFEAFTTMSAGFDHRDVMSHSSDKPHIANKWFLVASARQITIEASMAAFAKTTSSD